MHGFVHNTCPHGEAIPQGVSLLEEGDLEAGVVRNSGLKYYVEVLPLIS